MNRSGILKEILIYLMIVLIGVVVAISYVLFVVPNDFAPAGINGIAVMIQYKCNVSISYIALLINVPLCVFAFFCVDKKFALRTLTFCLAYAGFYQLFKDMTFFKQFEYATQTDTIYPVLIAGVLSGFCAGILVRANGSTGGTDIVSKYVSKVKPELNFFWVIFVINAVIAIASYFVYGHLDAETGTMIYNYDPVCKCLIYCFMSSFIGDRIISGSKQAYQFIIITEHAADIEKEIIEKLNRSATKLVGTGSYTHAEKEVLLCVVNKHQVLEVEQIIKKYPETFSYVEHVDRTFGNFKKMHKHL